LANRKKPSKSKDKEKEGKVMKNEDRALLRLKPSRLRGIGAFTCATPFNRYPSTRCRVRLSGGVAVTRPCISPWLAAIIDLLKELFGRPPAETETIEAKKTVNLTSREQEVFTMLLDGRAPKEIAYTLKISYPTVNFHITNLYRKLKIHSRAELFAMQMRN
jgi:DNA-binding CsgD family transcriptional regulator